jgi:hypothetical protein
MELTSPKTKLPSYSAPSLQRNLPLPCIIPFINAPSYLQPLSECAHPISIDRNYSAIMAPENNSFILLHFNRHDDRLIVFFVVRCSTSINVFGAEIL